MYSREIAIKVAFRREWKYILKLSVLEGSRKYW